MKILNDKYDIHPRNYHKLTPSKLKGWADALLSTILVFDPIMMAIPDFQGKEWVMWGWNAFVVLFKFFTKSVTTNGN